jgi:hypothetical protein
MVELVEPTAIVRGESQDGSEAREDGEQLFLRQRRREFGGEVSEGGAGAEGSRRGADGPADVGAGECSKAMVDRVSRGRDNKSGNEQCQPSTAGM